MKTLVRNLLILAAALSVSANALAYDFEVDGIYYNIVNITESTCEVVAGDNEYTGNVEIPLSVVFNGRQLSVVSIGSFAFDGCSSLTSVTIPNSVTSIGFYAFEYCSSLTSVTIPESVTTINSSAFYRCSSLTSVTIPNSVTSIGSNAFEYCSSLTSVTIPNSVTSIGSRAFNNCSGLKEFIIENGDGALNLPDFSGTPIETIYLGRNMEEFKYNSPFYEMSTITKFTIGSGVNEIYNRTFEGCTGLKELIIEDSDAILILGSALFYDCPLETVYIGRNLKYGNNTPFSGAGEPLYVTMGNSVTEIPDRMFFGCESLLEVTIGDSVENIGDYAFNGCFRLSELKIPASVTTIGSYAFSGCSSLADIASLNTVPPVISTDTFDSKHYLYSILKVPANSLEAYKTAEGWKNFWNIVSDADGGIDGVEDNAVNVTAKDGKILVEGIDGIVEVEVYNLSGQLVYGGTETVIGGLEKGVYIVRAGGQTFKVAL